MSEKQSNTPLPNVFSGNKLLKELFEMQLKDFQGTVTIIIDAPWGYAFACQEEIKAGSSLIVTDNPCAEYIEDLWDLEPTVLIAESTSLEDFIYFAKKAVQGNSFKLTPKYQSRLTKTERKILRLSALQMSITKTADLVGLSEGSLKNALSQLYTKLELRSHSELGLYYFGALENTKYLRPKS